MSRDIKRNMLRMKPNFNPTTFVTFGSGRGFNRKIAFKNNYWYSFFDVSSLDHPGIKDCYTDGDMFVLFGHVTWEDEHWFRSRDFPYVVVSRSSPKNADEYAKAAALTVKTFTPDNTILFDGLPYEAGEARGKKELRMMGLNPTPQAWRSVKNDVLAASGKIPVRRATKATVLSELHRGNSNVLFLIAHSDSRYLFLPGLAGEKISIQELDRISRDVAPDRVIVLLACKTGELNGETQSIAEIMIKNRLASVVYASDDYLRADDLPGMFRKLENGTPSKAFDELRAIVEIEPPVKIQDRNN